MLKHVNLGVLGCTTIAHKNLDFHLQIPSLELRARTPVVVDTSNEAIPQCQWRFSLLWVFAHAHADVSAAHARVEDADLDFIWGRGVELGGYDGDVGFVAERGDLGFAYCGCCWGGHF
jgi:hypothetical protein